MDLYSVWSFLSGFFHWPSWLQGPSMSERMSMSCSILWLSNIPLCGWTTFALPVLLSVDIWVIFSFYLLWLVMLWIFIYRFCLNTCSQFFWVLLWLLTYVVQLLRQKRKKQQEDKVRKDRFQLLHLGFLFQLTSVLWEPTTKSFVATLFLNSWVL